MTDDVPMVSGGVGASVSMVSSGSGVSGDEEEKDDEEELTHDDDEKDVDEINLLRNNLKQCSTTSYGNHEPYVKIVFRNC